MLRSILQWIRKKTHPIHFVMPTGGNSSVEIDMTVEEYDRWQIAVRNDQYREYAREVYQVDIPDDEASMWHVKGQVAVLNNIPTYKGQLSGLKH